MNWFWMNIPLAAAFFAAWTAIPLWLVLRQRGTGPGPLALSRAGDESHREGIDQRMALTGHSVAGLEAGARGDVHDRRPFCPAGMCALSELTSR